MTTPQPAPYSHHSSSDKTVRVVINGRVQGVFYRNWTIENASELGLKGWVRNRRDGSVEALFSGNPDAVQEMEQRCRRGPPDALVTGLQISPRLRHVAQGLAVLATRKAAANDVCHEKLEVETDIPDDCKERFFTILADKSEEKFRLLFQKILHKGHAVLAAKKPGFNSVCLEDQLEGTTVVADDNKDRKVEELARVFIQKMQRRLAILVPKRSGLDDDVMCFEELDVTTVLPDDVKEGCFTVFAVNGEETQRFVIELAYLSDPAFIRLLDEAAEEYGFEQNGALVVPCRPEELRQILED